MKNFSQRSDVLGSTSQTFFMFSLSCKIFLTVSLSEFTVSAIIRVVIRRSPCTVSLILVSVCKGEIDTSDLDADHLQRSLGFWKTIYIVRKHAHEIENFHHSPLSTTYSPQPEFFLI